MLKRIITSIVAIAVFLPFLFFSGEPKWVFLIATALLSAVSVYEICRCTSLSKNMAVLIPGLASAVLINILARYYKQGTKFASFALIILFVYTFYLLTLATFSKGKIKIIDVSVTAVMVFYVTLSFAMLLRLRDLQISGFAAGGEVYIGGKLYLLAFIFAWLPDTGGYFAGRFFGKHKLIPDVSPKKTVEGFIGGIIFSFIAGLIYCFIIGAKGQGFVLILTASVICALVSVCGDLIASVIKRHYGIKDYGFIFPGHGGVLDRFDSVLAVTPVLYIICYLALELGWIAGGLF